jgi:hypothetical protein
MALPCWHISYRTVEEEPDCLPCRIQGISLYALYWQLTRTCHCQPTFKHNCCDAVCNYLVILLNTAVHFHSLMLIKGDQAS